MCAAVATIASGAREAAASAAWRQWAALGAPVTLEGAPAHAVIDLEALLLLSAFLRGSERRLDDVMAWWASAGSALSSVQRTTTLLRQFPDAARPGIAAFAAEAVKAGDGRWKTLAAGGGEPLTLRGKRGSEPRLVRVPALMLRLRAGFGVGVKADLLAVLLAESGQRATIRALSQSTGYTPAAVRRAAQEMSQAEFVHQARGRPAAYYVDRESWRTLLGIDGDAAAGWRSFAQAFALLAAIVEWGERQRESSVYLASTSARDLVETHREAFELNRIPLAKRLDSLGGEYLDTFAAIVASLADWLREKL